MTTNAQQPRGENCATPAVDDAIEGYAVDVSANIATIEAIDFRGYRGGEVVMRSGSTATLSIYSSPTESGTFGLKADDGGTDLQITIAAADKPYELPCAVFGSRFLKLVGDAAGVFDVALKG